MGVDYSNNKRAESNKAEGLMGLDGMSFGRTWGKKK